MLSDTHLIRDHLITQLDADVNDTVKSGADAETGLADTVSLEEELDLAVVVYIDNVIGYLEQFIDVAALQVQYVAKLICSFIYLHQMMDEYIYSTKCCHKTWTVLPEHIMLSQNRDRVARAHIAVTKHRPCCQST